MSKRNPKDPVILVTIGDWAIVDVNYYQDYFVHMPCFEDAKRNDFNKVFPANAKYHDYSVQENVIFPDNCRPCTYCHMGATAWEKDRIHKFVTLMYAGFRVKEH